MNARMPIVSFLRDGESIVRTDQIKQEQGKVDFDIHTLHIPGQPDGDEVLLDIKTKTEASVLIGGNPLQLKVEAGLGTLTLISLYPYQHNESIQLYGGREVSVRTDNMLYWYERDPNSPQLVIRDHCDDFNIANEPSALDVLSALSSPLGSIK